MEYTGERFMPEDCNGEIAIEHYQRYQFAKQFAVGKKVLDAACGEGYGSKILAEAAKSVIGLDISEEAVKDANIKYGNEKLSYINGSIQKLPFEEDSFDVIVSFETIEHVNEKCQQDFLREIMRVLKPDGTLIMSTPNKKIYTDLVEGENEFHIKEFYIQEFVDYLKKKFSDIQLMCQYPSIGYFITKENEEVTVKSPKTKYEESRYVIAICSNQKKNWAINTSNLEKFDDSVYYFLNLQAHRYEKQILSMKTETDKFEKQQEEAIQSQKEYIAHLEKDIQAQKEYISHLEKDIQTQKEYINHLEGDFEKLEKELKIN